MKLEGSGRERCIIDLLSLHLPEGTQGDQERSQISQRPNQDSNHISHD